MESQDEKARRLAHILGPLYRTYEKRGPRAAISDLELVLGSCVEDAEIKQVLLGLKTEWELADDENYTPPPPATRLNYGPLGRKATSAKKQGEVELAFDLAWAALRRCAFGTIDFSHLLGLTLTCAVLSDRKDHARLLCRLYIDYFQMLSHLEGIEGVTPTWTSSGEQGPPLNSIQIARGLSLTLPADAASIALRSGDDDPCWRELLFLAIDAERPAIGAYHIAVSSLRKILPGA